MGIEGDRERVSESRRVQNRVRRAARWMGMGGWGKGEGE